MAGCLNLLVKPPGSPCENISIGFCLSYSCWPELYMSVLRLGGETGVGKFIQLTTFDQLFFFVCFFFCWWQVCFVALRHVALWWASSPRWPKFIKLRYWRNIGAIWFIHYKKPLVAFESIWVRWGKMMMMMISTLTHTCRSSIMTLLMHVSTSELTCYPLCQHILIRHYHCGVWWIAIYDAFTNYNSPVRKKKSASKSENK